MRALSATATLVIVAYLTGGVRPAQPTGVGGDKDKAEKVVAVTRDAIRSTRADPGKLALQGWEGTSRDTFLSVRTAASKTSVSNIFLIEAADFPEALWVTERAYSMYGPPTGRLGEVLPRPALYPPPVLPLPPPAKEAQVWVVAYLGSESDDRWSLDRVECSASRVRVAYRDYLNRPGGGGAMTGTVSPHLIWAPLGKLAPGRYAVELYETFEKQVQLTRMVTVK